MGAWIPGTSFVGPKIDLLHAGITGTGMRRKKCVRSAEFATLLDESIALVISTLRMFRGV